MPLGASERCPLPRTQEKPVQGPRPTQTLNPALPPANRGRPFTEVLIVAATLPALSVVISELHDGEASFLVELPFGSRPAHDHAVLLEIKRRNLNRSHIGSLILMMPDVVHALYGDGPIAVVGHHHFRAPELPSGVPFHWFPVLVNAHEHISGLSGPLVVPDAPTIPLALAKEEERHDRRYKGRYSLDGAPVHPLTSCGWPQPA